MADRIVESDGFRILSRLDDLLESFECTAADKEDIRRINLNKLLMRMLSSALRRNGSYSSSRIFSSACCTPSPETSRVIEAFSDFLVILSISSM